MTGRPVLILKRWTGFAKIACQMLKKKKMSRTESGMITSDYKNGYNIHKRARCATSKREKSRTEMFLVDTLVGLIGGLMISLPIAIWAIATY